MTKKTSDKETKPAAIKQPLVTNFAQPTDADGLCDQKDFDYLRSKGFEAQVAKSCVTFSMRSKQHADTVINIRCENNKWSCAVVRSWDTKANNYDASFSAKYNTLDELLEKTQKDFSARAVLLDTIKR